MKYCEDYAALLDLYVDGELSLEEMLEVQAHLDECPACQAYVDDALDMRAAFPDMEDTEVPEGFAEGVMSAIQASSAGQGSVPRKKKKTPWAGVLVSLAACCAIVIIQQNGPFAGGGNKQESAVAYTTADCATEETVAEECEDTVAYSEAAESEVWDDAGTAEEAGLERQADLEEKKSDETAAGTESAIITGDAAEEPAEAAPVHNTSMSVDSWVEYDNVVFACVVYLPQNRVGDVLDGYEGKPYSNANYPEEGIIGTGYALEQAEFERILYDEFDYLHGPVLNQDRTTELCCIVVTESAE